MALQAEARRREVHVSVVVREALRRFLGVVAEAVELSECKELHGGSRKRQYRLWIDMPLWNQLVAEASKRGLRPAALIRERLWCGGAAKREAVSRMRVPSQPDEGERSSGTRPIAVFDLSE